MVMVMVGLCQWRVGQGNYWEGGREGGREDETEQKQKPKRNSNPDTKGCHAREVSSFQVLKEWYLGWEKVSCLERCPQFWGVLIEEFLY